MQNVGWLLLAIVIAYTCAVVAPVVHDRGGRFAGWCLIPAVLLCPVLIPPANVDLRALSAVVSGDLMFKLVDSFRHWRDGPGSLSLREYYRFLIPLPVFGAVYPNQRRRLSRVESPWPQIMRVCGGIAGCIVAVVTLEALSTRAAVRSSFALNHFVMLLAFTLAIESLSRALCGLEHLAGFDTTPIIRNAYLSPTVSEFWRRYNDRVHHWLYCNVFLPAGGQRRPVRSVLLVFLVSGLFHELAFAVATSRLTGYQLAFFTIQGPAALASRHLERLARRGGIAGKITAHGATILFLAVTSVLFFDGVRRVFPFIYASASPVP